MPVKNDLLVFGYRTEVTKYSLVGSEWRKTFLPAHSSFWARGFEIYNHFDRVIVLVKPGNRTCTAYDLDCLEECAEP